MTEDNKVEGIKAEPRKAEAKKRKRLRFPIRFKTIVMVIVFGLVLAEVAMVYFSLISSSNNVKNAKQTADNLSGVLSEAVDPNDFKTLRKQVDSIIDASSTYAISGESTEEEWNTYIAQFSAISESPLFISVRDELRRLVSHYEGELDCVYLGYARVVGDNRAVLVYVVDSAEGEAACPPGCLDELYDINKPVLDNPARGFPAYLTNTEQYGYLVTSGAPVFLGDEVVGCAFCDISMTQVRLTQADSIIQLFIYLVGSSIVISAIALIIVQFTLIRPIRKLNYTARAYSSRRHEDTHRRFQSLDIHSRDEIGDLAETLKTMENDVHTKINELIALNEELTASRMEASRMRELADTDALTGVKNKIAYNSDVADIDDKIARKEKVEFGLAMIDLNDLKVINDTLGHDRGDVALVNLSNLIATVFSRSKVYRFGGDEFVVLLTEYDYAHANRLVVEFNTKIYAHIRNSKLTKENQTSASIGYSAFNPATDKTVEEVFKRADEAMYRRKRKMKEEAKRQ